MSLDSKKFRRILAFAIDAAIVLAVCFVMYKITGKPDFYAVRQQMDLSYESQEAARMAYYYFNISWLIVIGIVFVYETITQTIFDASLGKRLMGLKIVPQNEKGKLPFKLVLIIRTLVKCISLYFLSGVPYALLGLRVLTNSKAQSGFDLICKTKTSVS